MTIRIFELPPKTGQISDSTKLATEDAMDDTNKTRMVSLSDVTPYTWAASDEDAPLSTGLLYTTEISVVARTIKNVVLSLKNAPTGSVIEVDVLKETMSNSNLFTTIFTTKLTIDINEFTSNTAAIPAVIFLDTWEMGRRLQIVLTINDSNFAASGLKVTLKS